jgi:hypothetical protein
MTAPVQLDPADLAALVAAIAAIPAIKAASYDPTDLLRTPAAWVRIDGIDTLPVMADGHTDVPVTIHLIVPAKPFTQAFADLCPLLDALVDVLTPTGPALVTGVVLPGSTAVLPALAVPFTLHTKP